MGMIGKYKIIFDTADTVTSDNIGAYLRASDGTLLTHTDVGGKKALDVNVANTITVTNAANYAEDIAHTTGDIGTQILSRRVDSPTSSAGTSGDYATFNTDADGRLYANIHDGGNSITVDGTVELGATTLAALESITVQNAGGASAVNIQDGGNSITVDGTVELGATTLAALESITVVATDLDIRDLTHASDSVKVGDGTDFWAIDTTGLGRVADYHTSAANAAVSIPTTAGGTALVASALSNRTELWVQNAGNKNIAVGVGTVTLANGLLLVPGSLMTARVGAALSLKAIADTGTQDVRTLEFA